MDNIMCLKIHELINNLPVYNYKNIDKIPFDDGIYFIFEDGEKYHNYRRIVKVGINKNGKNNLRKRLKYHYIRKNHGNSIFLKHVGGAFLNIANDDYLEIWYKKDSPKIKIDSVKENSTFLIAWGGNDNKVTNIQNYMKIFDDNKIDIFAYNKTKSGKPCHASIIVENCKKYISNFLDEANELMPLHFTYNKNKKYKFLK